jgi:hypothetical protein
VSEGEVWAVLWETNGIQQALDTDSRDGAHQLGAQLLEQGREKVRVVGPCEPDMPRADVEARLAKLGLRLRLEDDVRAAVEAGQEASR